MVRDGLENWRQRQNRGDISMGITYLRQTFKSSCQISVDRFVEITTKIVQIVNKSWFPVFKSAKNRRIYGHV